MKKILYIALAACFALSSCELERLPHNGYTPDMVAADPGSFDLLLTGVYGQMKAMMDNSHRAGEYPGDNVVKDKSSTDAFAPYISYLHIPSNYRSGNIWTQSYKVISQSSELMLMVDEATASVELKHSLGEAYFMRGLAYFYLTRVFGRPYYQSPETNMSVPIINGKPEDILSDGIQLADRSTVKDVYDQLIADFKKAEELMSLEKSAIYATKEAAQAMLSTVYLYMSGTYANPNTQYADLAIEYANKVIASGRFTMLTRDQFKNYNVTLPENNTETIMAIKRTDTDQRSEYYSSSGGLYSQAGGQGWNEMYASAKYMDRLRHSSGSQTNVIGSNAVDARGSFIRPYYTGQSRADTEAGNTPTTGADYFRVIVDAYTAEGVLSSFVWMQFETEGGPGNWTAVVKTDHDNNPETPAQVTSRYPLTEVDGRYKMSYQPANAPAARDYIGDIDKQLTASNGNLKFSIFKNSLENNMQQLHSPIVVRLAEMYLNMAEAYVKKGDHANALTNINVIRNRAVVNNPITLEQITAHGADVVDNERTLELAWEAHRGFDAFRVGRTMERRYPGWMSATGGANINLIAIPADHDNVMQLLDQTVMNAYANYGGLTQNAVSALPAPTLEPYSPFVPY